MSGMAMCIPNPVAIMESVKVVPYMSTEPKNLITHTHTHNTYTQTFHNKINQHVRDWLNITNVHKDHKDIYTQDTRHIHICNGE